HPGRVLTALLVGSRTGPSVQALGARAVDVTVGHQGPVEGHAELPAVGVPGEDHVRAVPVHLVEGSHVGGVRDAHAEVDVWESARLSGREHVAVQVRVVDAHQGDPATVGHDRVATVGEVLPPG